MNKSSIDSIDTECPWIYVELQQKSCVSRCVSRSCSSRVPHVVRNSLTGNLECVSRCVRPAWFEACPAEARNTLLNDRGAQSCTSGRVTSGYSDKRGATGGDLLDDQSECIHGFCPQRHGRPARAAPKTADRRCLTRRRRTPPARGSQTPSAKISGTQTCGPLL